MSDPVAMHKWLFNSVAALLIIEGIIEIINTVYKKDQTTVHQARMWIRSLLMIVAGLLIFWITQGTKVSLNLPKINNGGGMGGNGRGLFNVER